MNILCWFGPVSRMQIAGSVPPGYELGILGCTGDGSDGKPQCREHAAAWLADGRRLPGARRRLGVGDGPVVCAAFSAGGQIVKRLCEAAADRAELAGVYLADGTYTTTWKKRGTEAGVDEITAGFVTLALEAIRDGRFFCATASSFPNKEYPTGAQTLSAIRAEIERLSGRPFADASSDPLLQGLTPPVRAGRIENVVLVDFGDRYKHGEHATVIAPILLPRMLAPGGAARAKAPGAQSPGPSTSRSWWRWPAVGAAAALFAYLIARRRR